MSQGSRIWYQGCPLQDGSFKEFNKNCTCPISDLNDTTPRSQQDSRFTYAITDIDHISDALGIPWERSKDQPFSSSTVYIGFLWNLDMRTISLSPEKIDKYLCAISKWNDRSTHVLEDVQKLYGKLLHTSSLIPAGHAYLTGLERMLAICTKKPFMLHRPEKTIKDDLVWWNCILTSSAATQPIVPPPPFVDLNAYSDASSSIGIGIVIGERWRAWRLLPDWQVRSAKRDIAWAEAIEFELLIQSLASIAPTSSQRHTIVYGTTPVLLRAGEPAVTAIALSTRFSNGSTTSYPMPTSHSNLCCPNLFLASTTQPTPHHQF